ncbi:MAG: FadR family transcriptional regulator [Alphaproteobacteria bacterium]|nr:FadR family transcriptional regulator [Alphaproteobacteria bacterium]
MARNRPTPSFLPSLPNRTGQLIDILSSEIRSRKFRPGERLPTEQEMVARFQVSRTVVREAIAAMRAEGLVVTRQGAGAFVTQGAENRPFRIVSEELRSFTEILQVMRLRLAVEVEAAGLAAESRNARALAEMGRCLDVIDDAIRAGDVAVEEDFAFHLAIAAATGNPYFERFMHFLGTIIIPRQSLPLGMDNAAQRSAYLGRVQVEHRNIYAAIRDADAEAARRAARAHLELSVERYRRLVEATA